MGPKPKVEANTEMKYITLKIVGGEAPSNAVLSSRLSPFGCNPKKAGEEIMKRTKDYTNIRLYVKLSIQSREIKELEMFPTCSAHIIKELKEPVRKRRAVKNAVYKHKGNLTLETVKTIAKKMQVSKSLSRTLKGSVKEVLGSCIAVGITVDGKSPKVVTKEVNSGKHNL